MKGNADRNWNDGIDRIVFLLHLSVQLAELRTFQWEDTWNVSLYLTSYRFCLSSLPNPSIRFHRFACIAHSSPSMLCVKRTLQGRNNLFLWKWQQRKEFVRSKRSSCLFRVTRILGWKRRFFLTQTFISRIYPANEENTTICDRNVRYHLLASNRISPCWQISSLANGNVAI